MMQRLGRALIGVLALLALTFGSLPAQAGFARAPISASPKIALVIGNSDYQGRPSLQNSLRDADGVAAALRDLGFQVTQAQNQTRNQTLASLAEFFVRARGAEIALIYYAGNGFHVGGRSYVAPVDAGHLSGDPTLKSIDVASFAAAVEGASALGLVLLDSSLDNPFAQQGGEWPFSSAVQGPLILKPNVMAAYSTSFGMQALNGPNNALSPYAEAMIAALRGPPLPVERLLGQVRDQVVAATEGEQIPHLQGYAGPNIYLHPQGAAAPLGAADPCALVQAPSGHRCEPQNGMAVLVPLAPPPVQAASTRPPSPAPAPGGVRAALIIGNSAYEHSPFLPNPLRDAERMRATLLRLGFQPQDVELVSNASKSDLEAALRRFSSKAWQADTAVLFYAGHAMEIAGENYLIPVEARLEREGDAPLEAVRLRDALRGMDAATRLSVAFIDACRTNDFSPNRGMSRGFAAQEPSSPRMILSFSTAPRQVARDGYGVLSPYTQALTELLEREPNADLRQSLTSLGARVEELARGPQNPKLEVSSGFQSGEHVSLTGAR